MGARRVALLAGILALTAAVLAPIPRTPDATAAVLPHQVGLVDVTQGLWHLRNTTGGITSFYFGNPGDVPFMGDWDCDGVATPGLFRSSDAYAYLSNANRAQVADIRFFFGNPSDIPLAGDFNGDGCDTLSLYRPLEQVFYVMNQLGENEGGLGAADYSFGFGNPGDKPVVGDWDGDGIDEIGLHRESTGYFYYRNTLDTGVASDEFYFGDPGDRFIAGDWGIVDGRDTPAVFRPSTKTFYFRHRNAPGVADSEFVWGDAVMVPVAGDFGLTVVTTTLDATVRATKTIGAAGGTLTLVYPNGHTATLAVPPGALGGDTAITLTRTASVDGLAAGTILLAGVDLAPDGIQLASPATITYSLPAWADPGGVEAVVTADGTAYSPPATASGGTFTVPITHFSTADIFTSTVSQLDASLTCRDQDGTNQEIQQLLSDEYLRDQADTRDIKQRIFSNEQRSVFEIDETWGNPSGRHARILSLVEVDETTDPPTYSERVRVRQYDAQGNLDFSSDQVDGVDVPPAQLEGGFGPDFAAPPATPPSPEELTKALDLLRRSHCGYVTIFPADSKMKKGFTDDFVASVYDKFGVKVNTAAVEWSTLPGGPVSVVTKPGGFADVTADTVGHAVVTATEAGNTARRGVATVEVVDGFPSIDVAKTPDDGTVEQGFSAVFTITVHNSGDLPLVDVAVADPQCDVLQLVAESLAEDGILQVGEHWTYSCIIPDAQTDIVNSAIASAKYEETTVTDSDTGSITVVEGSTTTTTAAPARLEIVGMSFGPLSQVGSPDLDQWIEVTLTGPPGGEVAFGGIIKVVDSNGYGVPKAFLDFPVRMDFNCSLGLDGDYNPSLPWSGGSETFRVPCTMDFDWMAARAQQKVMRSWKNYCDPSIGTGGQAIPLLFGEYEMYINATNLELAGLEDGGGSYMNEIDSSYYGTNCCGSPVGSLCPPP